jgi:arylesterase/paraoxonase
MKGISAMVKKLFLVAMILVVVAGGWFLHLLWITGQFKTIEPHFAGECTPISGVVGPEDITIHPETGIAYISASDWRAVNSGKSPNGGIYAYDLNSNFPQLIHITPGAGNDFHPHGISLYVGENGQDSLFVVNHGGGRHRIEIYDLRGGRLFHRKTIVGPMLVSPNDIVAVGPDQFYVSNDHRYTSGIRQVLENYLRLKLSNVVYYDGSRFAEAASGIGYANGINVSSNGKIIYLCAVTEGALYIFNRDIASGELTLQQKIDLGTGVDNIEMDSDGGLWIGAHPQLLSFVQHAQDPTKLSPSQILYLNLKSDDKYEVKEIYLNKGEEISASSVAAVYKDRMLIGAVFDPKFLDCKR